MKRFALLGLLLLFGSQALSAQKKAARIEAIHQAQLEVQAELARYDSLNLELDGMSEGVTIRAYYQEKDLKLIRVSSLYEKGELKTEYYFKDDGLYFISNQYFSDQDEAQVEEQRYYFRKEKLFHCLDSTKEIPDTDENWEIGRILLDQGLDLRARLQERL